MKDDKRPSLKKPDIQFLSFMGVGFIPKAPGTFGTLATLPFLYVLGLFNTPFFFFIPFILILTATSSFIADHVQRRYDLHDPQWIVIDEVIGMSITWLFTSTHSLSHLILQFVLFRFFDIVKIWPASFFDIKVKHGAGTILDDVVSGIYAGLVYKIIILFLPLA
jgi:phosphatidylglycerophosphatase A